MDVFEIQIDARYRKCRGETISYPVAKTFTSAMNLYAKMNEQHFKYLLKFSEYENFIIFNSEEKAKSFIRNNFSYLFKLLKEYMKYSYRITNMTCIYCGFEICETKSEFYQLENFIENANNSEIKEMTIFDYIGE